MKTQETNFIFSIFSNPHRLTAFVLVILFVFVLFDKTLIMNDLANNKVYALGGLIIQLSLIFLACFFLFQKITSKTTAMVEESVKSNPIQTDETTISKLQIINHKLQAILESTPDSHILIGTDYRVISFNKAAFNQIKALHKLEIVEGNDIRLYIGDSLKSLFEDNFARVLQGETIITTREFENTEKDKFWFQIRYFPVYDEAQDKIVSVSFNASNVSKLISQHEKLKESESRFRRIADATPVMIWMAGTDHLCNYFNKSWLEFTGKCFEQELGNGWLESIHPEDLEYVLETCQLGYQFKHTFEMEWRMRRYDGEYRWVLDKGIPRFSENGDFQGFIGSCVEISDLKSFTEKIERQNGVLKKALTKTRNLAMIVSKTNNLVILTNEEGQITWVNQAFNNLTGYSSREVIGRKPWEILQGMETNPATIKKISQAIQKKEIIHTEMLNYCKNGEKYWVDMLIEPFYDDKRKLMGFMSIQIDITERKQSEHKIMKQYESLREIAFIQSHVVRKPVANILGILDLIEQEELTEENADLLHNLNLSTQELDQIIHQIVHKINELD